MPRIHNKRNDSGDGTERTKWFMRDRFGMFIHWGLYSIPARGEWVRSTEKIPDEAYQPFFEEFNPVRFDPRQWARIARLAGQKYAVLTAKHHDGFCLFDSKLTDYTAANTPAKRDLVGEYVEAFRAEGLKVGLYYSLLDWHHADYPVDQYHPLRDVESAKSGKREFGRYVDYLHGQVKEILTNYGKIDILWLDFSYDKMSGEVWRTTDLLETIRTLQPHIIMDNRLVAGHCDLRSGLRVGDFATPEQIVPERGIVDGKGNAIPWESCITLNDHWGYANADHNYKSAQEVVRTLVECVSKNGNLLLNVGPNSRGEIPEESVRILERVGSWMRVNSAGICGCGAASLPKPEWGRYTQCGNVLYAHILEKPAGPVALRGLSGRIGKARLLADGSEIRIEQPWNATDCKEDAFFNPPGNQLPDSLDTVVAFELKA
ncbi:MAG: alpha-L-fucosidase [Verrucomicrobia bacterium]|nr:alpha-L-fucosidase [Verrucomicrobiota bacterium]MCG2681257.1 alpha-L-fucosidase [Kiritimatiellia bacterium]MBU4246925.1 alpha-L-fucosidase [Verrucomicrobiota bacterium]MBU4291593.1 alpha-L-fucosidase [Verrucomicrobiota bacterium]MBU4428312.1 alpha-L-fucosidase [Verrucomicrobiota bacterium]